MLLLISKFVNSQAAAIAAFVPLALGIGVPPGVIVAFTCVLRLLHFANLSERFGGDSI